MPKSHEVDGGESADGLLGDWCDGDDPILGFVALTRIENLIALDTWTRPGILGNRKPEMFP